MKILSKHAYMYIYTMSMFILYKKTMHVLHN